MLKSPVTFINPLELSTLNGIIGAQINGVWGGDYSGWSVAGAGDVNADGISDLIIGAPHANSGGRGNAGSSFVVFGTRAGFGGALALSALNGTNGFRINGVSGDDYSGWSVAGAGDVNADGISDLIIGAYGASPDGRTNAGSSFVLFGTRAGFGAVLELSALNGTDGFRINGVSEYDYSGCSVASARDVNADGISDLIIGAYGASPGGRTDAGSSFVVFGTRAGFEATLELSTLNGTNGFRINGVSAGDGSGYSVASAGDVNADGISDLIIGAYQAFPSGQPNAGSSFVVFGTRAGFGAALELSTLNGVNGFRINGISADDGSGCSVAGAGDVNADGISDMIIGAYQAAPPGRGSVGSSFVVFGDGTEEFNNQLTISEGQSKVLTPFNLNAAFSRYQYTQYNITGLQHGQFEYTGQPGIAITSFSAPDVMAGRVNFTHDDSELEPSYLVTASHALTTVTSFANITFINHLPILVNNSLTINQGQTIQLDNTMLAAVDLDNPQHNPDIVFTIVGNANGFFSTFSFPQSQLWNGGVYFTQDNTIRAPQYKVSISRGGVTLAPQSAGVDFETVPVLQQNHFDVCQDQTVLITSEMLSALHPGAVSSDNLIFSIKYLQYGHFERINKPGMQTFVFSQSEVKNSSILFVQDGSPNPPSFMLTVAGNRITTPLNVGGVYFTYAPVLRTNALALNQGQTVILNGNMLNAVDPNNVPQDLVFTVSHVKQGAFINANTAQNITQFKQSQLNTHQIAFQTDGGPAAPSYMVSVQNQCSTSKPSAASIAFNSAPVIISNQLTITNGQPIILTSTELSATDRETPLVDLGFTISDIQHGYFDTITLPGTPIKVFSQQMLFNGAIRFVPENSLLLPSYNVSVSDGVLWTGPQPALVRLNPPSVAFNAASQHTVRNAIISSTISGVIGLGFFAFKYFLGKRMNDKLKAILEVDNSAVEKEQEAWKRETLLPVVREVFNHLKTTGLCGYRDETSTKGYVRGLELLLTELKKQGTEIDLTKLSVTERRRLMNAIVEEIQAQLVKPRSCCTRGWFMSFTRPAFTPADLNSAAVAIARVVAITLKEETEKDKVRIPLYKRANVVPDSYPIPASDVELESAGRQKSPLSVYSQGAEGQPPLAIWMAGVDQRFAKSEERSAKIEASLAELLREQGEAASERPKLRLVQ